jgi:hypothetical protein
VDTICFLFFFFCSRQILYFRNSANNAMIAHKSASHRNSFHFGTVQVPAKCNALPFTSSSGHWYPHPPPHRLNALGTFCYLFQFTHLSSEASNDGDSKSTCLSSKDPVLYKGVTLVRQRAVLRHICLIKRHCCLIRYIESVIDERVNMEQGCSQEGGCRAATLQAPKTEI